MSDKKVIGTIYDYKNKKITLQYNTGVKEEYSPKYKPDTHHDALDKIVIFDKTEPYNPTKKGKVITLVGNYGVTIMPNISETKYDEDIFHKFDMLFKSNDIYWRKEEYTHKNRPDHLEELVGCLVKFRIGSNYYLGKVAELGKSENTFIIAPESADSTEENPKYIDLSDIDDEEKEELTFHASSPNVYWKKKEPSQTPEKNENTNKSPSNKKTDEKTYEKTSNNKPKTIEEVVIGTEVGIVFPDDKDTTYTGVIVEKLDNNILKIKMENEKEEDQDHDFIEINYLHKGIIWPEKYNGGKRRRSTKRKTKRNTKRKTKRSKRKQKRNTKRRASHRRRRR